MSQVRLLEADWKGSFPPICIRCGLPPTQAVSRTFKWFPPLCFLGLFLGLVPFGILVLLLTRKATVTRLPVCSRHRWHWDVAFAVGALHATAFVVMLIVAIMMMADRGNSTRVSSGEMAVWVGLWFTIVAWMPLTIQ